MIKAYFETFVNWKENNWAKVLLIIQFAYNNAKNANITYTLFKLNCSYYLRNFFKKDFNSYLKSYWAKKLDNKLKTLRLISQ